MPKAMHKKLVNQAAKKGLKEDAKNAYVYGTMQKTKTNKKHTYKKLRGRM